MLVAGAVALYYGWWAIKYRAGLGWGQRKAKAPAADDRLTKLYAELSADGMKMAGVRTGPGQEANMEAMVAAGGVPDAATSESREAVMLLPAVTGELQETMPVTMVIEPEGGDFLPVVATGLLKRVAALVERAAREEIQEEELAAGLGELMRQGPYCRLKGTIYQGKVTDEIVQALTSLGSIRLDAERVRGLWDG